MTNEELIRRYRAGDRQALNTLTENNIGLVKSICKRFTRRGRYWEDHLQECYLAFTVAVNGFQESRGYRFSTYASRVMWNHMDNRVAFLRARKRRSVAASLGYCQGEFCDQILAIRLEPWERIEQNEEVKHLLKVVSKRDRKILMLSMLGLTNPEVGKRFGITPQRVDQIKRRAIQLIRESYEIELL